MNYRSAIISVLSVFLAIALILSGFPAKVFPPGTSLAASTGSDSPDGYVANDGVRLISYPQLSQNGTAGPVITGFRPTSGQPGDSVNITGANFTPRQPGDTAVDFSGVPAEVLSVTDNETTVVVPVGAVTGPIRVRTPAGQTISGGDFTVTFMRSIQLQLPAGLNPQDYTVINKYGDAKPDENGLLSLPSSDQDITFNSAVPDSQIGAGADNLTDERAFFQLDALEAEPGQTVTMDAMSTAKAMVFLSPYLFTPLVERVQIILATMVDDPKVAALAQVIEEVYPDVAYPLDDARVVTALHEAIQSVNDRLPAEYAVTLSSILRTSGESNLMEQPGIVRAPGTAGALPPVRSTHQGEEAPSEYWKSIDLYMMKHSLFGPGKLKIESVGSNPLDWFIRMAELDPAQFARGMQSIENMRRHYGDNVYVQNQSFQRLPGEQPTLVVPAKAFFKNFDLIGNFVNWLIPGATETLPFDSGRDAVYAVRMVNPSRIWMWGTPGTEWSFIPNKLPNGSEDALKALAVNVVMAVLDGISIFIDVKAVFSDDQKLAKFVTDLMLKAAALLEQEFPGSGGLGAASETELTLGVIKVLGLLKVEALKMAAGMLVQGGLTAAVGTMGKVILKSIFDIFGKISKIGSLGERAAYLATGTGMGYEMTPLETMFFVVGDPFSPRITGFSPLEGKPEDTVTISGQRFKESAADNTVYFGGVKAVVTSATESQLIVEVPDWAVPGNVTISVATASGRGESETTFRVIRQPVIESVKPQGGFVPAADFRWVGDNFPGTEVVLQGRGFDPDTDSVTVGGVAVSDIVVDYSSFTRLAFRVPNGAVTGPIEVTTPEGLKASWPFTLLGPPVVQQQVFEGPIGMLLTIPVLNLSGVKEEVWVTVAGTAPTSFMLNGAESITFRVPLSVPEGQSTITVTTPAGSDTTSVTIWEELARVYAGTITPSMPEDDFGSDPYNLSLREAVAAASGNYTLWDDYSDNVTLHTYQQEDDWVWILDPMPPFPTPGPGQGGPGNEYRTVDLFYHYNDGSVVGPVLWTIDLDTPSVYYEEAEMEEADYLTGYTEAAYPPSADTIDRIIIGGPDSYTLSLPGTLKLGPYDYLGSGVIDASLSSADPLFELSHHNIITGKIRNARGVAVLMGPGAHDNLLPILPGSVISGAGRTAIQIGPGAYANQVMGTRIIGMTGSGIVITGNGTHNNVIENIMVGLAYDETGTPVIDGSDTGWGIVISDGANHNSVKGYDVVDNQAGGILITGNGTDHNQVAWTRVGFFYDYSVSPAEYRPAGNYGDGIRIADGAKYNTINVSEGIGSNQGDGVVITGQGTSGNLLVGSYIGFRKREPEKDLGNAGNGVRLSAGASENVLNWVRSQYNGGYAVLIEGEGTDNNLVTHSTLGSGDPWYEGGLKGQGGLTIRNGPKGNEVRSNRLGGTLGDAVLISNAGDAGQPNRLWNNNIGYRYQPGGGFQKVAWPDGRSGIRLEAGAQHNIIDINRVINEPTGVVITGSGTSYNLFRFNDIQHAQASGILVTDGADFNSIDSTRVYQSGQDGIVVDNSDNTSLLTMLVDEGGGSGIVIRNGAGNTLIDTLTPPATYVPPPQEERYAGVEGKYSPVANLRRTEVTNFTGHGIVVEASSWNTIINTSIKYNGGDGVLMRGPNTTTTEISSGYIADNGGHGIHITDNVTGVLVDGSTIVQNAQWGVLISNSSDVRLFNNTIGHIWFYGEAWGNGGGVAIQNSAMVTIGAPGMGNSISGNLDDGLYLSGAGTQDVEIMNNIIGLGVGAFGVAGDVAIANQGDGIRITNGASRVTIGDDSDEMRNIISGNTGNGIHISDATTTDIRVVGNYIGTDIDGKTALGNQANGILLDGGVNNLPIGPGNIISGNTLSGVRVAGLGTDSNRILGNLIGLNVDRQPLGNGGDGISVTDSASQNRVFKNFIWHNTGNGVAILGGATRNTISNNSITGNGGKGIALATGGNNEIPAPRIAYYRSGMIQGEVDATIPERTPVEVFADDEDEGMLPLGTTYVNRGRFVLRAPVPAGAKVTATVTDANGNTSQFGGKETPTQPPLVGFSAGPDGLEMMPDDTRVVFTSTSGNNSDIYLMDSTMTQAVSLTTALEDDYSPALSPDGARIVFVSERDGNPEIYTVSANSSNLARLTSGNAADYDPSWSPDGSQIVFVSERDGNPEIYVMAAGGANLTRLTVNTAIDRYPTWSHDGTRIAFTSHRDGNSEIYVMAADGTSLARLTNEPLSDYQASWSPDDSKLVFVSERDGSPEMYIMNSDGTGLTRLTDNSAAEAHPSWLFGTNWIAFQSNLDGDPEIYAMTSDGLNLRRITVRFGMNIEPDWVLGGGVVSHLPGDANGDGNVNALDITKVERIIAGLDFPPFFGVDANLDGNINALDITKVERIIAGLD